MAVMTSYRLYVHSARSVSVWDLSSRALCPPRTSARIMRKAIGMILRDLEHHLDARYYFMHACLLIIAEWQA